ncbi:MAG: NAD-dependent epimerase/dehydratase family protein [Nitrosomonadaceae bacterium]|jgi:dihydroflavonol-4-reductase|nr:NAD-dependent epimerase/dehydratase family protein [Nitrosomonadaceae bacterium]|tara:strand:+ start:115 stop:1107 length:993 start_codon:yes stop_codon:yes gene_type:complete
MKSLVTGANGFVGSAVARCLLEAGHEVRCLVRAGSDQSNLKGLPVEISEGDLRDVSSLKRAVSNCENLFHVAADYRLWVPDPETMYDINVKGTQELILAAYEADVSRIIYTSSVATLGINSDASPANESTPSSLNNMTGHYKRSKFLAEQVVQHLTNKHQLPLVIVNPSTPVGPRDIKPTPTGQIVLDTLCGRMPAYMSTGLNVAHVDDIAQGHLLAYMHGKTGERYILGGENLHLIQILQAIDEIIGKKIKRMNISMGMMLPVAWIMEKVAIATNTQPRASVDSIRMAEKKMFFSSEKAIRDLGYQYRPSSEAIQDAVTWFQNNGYCKG